MNEQRVLQILFGSLTVVVLAVVAGAYSVLEPRLTAIAAVAVAILGIAAFGGFGIQGLSRFEGSFMLLFTLVMGLTWSPLKLAAYLGPVILLGGLIVALSLSKNWLILIRCLTVGMIWVVVTACFFARDRGFVLQNSAISFITYSAFLPLWVVPTRWLAGEALFARISRWVVIVVTVEATLGILQFVNAAILQTGRYPIPYDCVDGTLHLPLGPSYAFDNVMYSVNMHYAVLFIAYLILVETKRLQILLWLGTLALLMSGVIHVTLTAIGAIIASAFFVNPLRHARLHPRLRATIRSAVIIGPLLTVLTIGSFLAQAPSYARHIIVNEGPKVLLAKRVLIRIPREDPAARILGFGPGQFCSRAALIGAGYLGPLPSPLQVTMPEAFARYANDLWFTAFGHLKRGLHSAIAKPASSWLSVVGEFGFFGFGIVACLLARVLWITRRASRQRGQFIEGFLLTATVLFTFGLGAWEFHWETVQVIFLGLLYAKLMFARLLYADAPTPLHA